MTNNTNAVQHKNIKNPFRKGDLHIRWKNADIVVSVTWILRQLDFYIRTGFLTRSHWLKLLWSLLEIQEHLQNKAGSCKARETNDIAKAEEFGMIIDLVILFYFLLNIWSYPDLERKKKKKRCICNKWILFLESEEKPAGFNN